MTVTTPCVDLRTRSRKSILGRAAVDSQAHVRRTWHSGDNRSALHREMAQAVRPIELLACANDDAIRWTRVVPRSTLPGITENRALARILDDDPDAWSVSCFVVRREHRGRGVGIALLNGAVVWAAQHGASVLDGHPVDIDGLTGTPSPSALFTGSLAMFPAAGFIEIGRTYRTRPVMRRSDLHAVR